MRHIPEAGDNYNNRGDKTEIQVSEISIEIMLHVWQPKQYVLQRVVRHTLHSTEVATLLCAK
jgi:hypothetical protein